MIKKTFQGTNHSWSIQVFGKKDFADVSEPDEILSLLKKENPGKQLYLSTQTHSDIALDVARHVPTNSIFLDEADALYTTDCNFAISIRVADCVPILFYSSQEQIFGAIHSGWRGLHKKILSKTIQEVLSITGEETPHNLHFFIGPHIHAENYEVGKDVHELFAPEHSLPHSDNPEKRMLDQEKILRAEFQSLGIKEEQIEWNNENTFSSSEYFSHRAGDKGRNYLTISCTQSSY